MLLPHPATELERREGVERRPDRSAGGLDQLFHAARPAQSALTMRPSTGASATGSAAAFGLSGAASESG